MKSQVAKSECGSRAVAISLPWFNDAKYRSAEKEAERLRDDQQKKQQRLHKKYIDVRTRWGTPRQWAAPVTLSLIVLSIVISIGTNSVGIGQRRSALLDYFLFTPTDQPHVEKWWDEHPDVSGRFDFLLRYWFDTAIRNGQAWRLISGVFVHWSILHLMYRVRWDRVRAMGDDDLGCRRFHRLIIQARGK